MHADEIPIDDGLVRRLISAQLPRFAALPLVRLEASGSTNVLFRLGREWLVRLPRQPGGGSALIKEQRWLPELGRRLPVAVPEVVALGEPAFGYPERWAVVRWLQGESLTAEASGSLPAHQRVALASDLADVVLALREEAVPVGASSDPSLRGYRGGPLAAFDAQMRRNVRACASIAGLELDLEAALAIWESALTLPGARQAGSDRWYHGDLVAENLLLRQGRLAAVLDFGGLGVGDPAVDLHGAWEVLDASDREAFRRRVGVDETEWLRSRAWALAIALGCLAYYWTSMPGRCRDRLVMARAALAAPD